MVEVKNQNVLYEKLDTLCKEMGEHVQYLWHNTYHPYDKEEQFTTRLRQIVFDHFEKL